MNGEAPGDYVKACEEANADVGVAAVAQYTDDEIKSLLEKSAAWVSKESDDYNRLHFGQTTFVLMDDPDAQVAVFSDENDAPVLEAVPKLCRELLEARREVRVLRKTVHTVTERHAKFNDEIKQLRAANEKLQAENEQMEMQIEAANDQ